MRSETIDRQFSFAPDGEHIVYSDASGIYLWSFQSEEAEGREVLYPGYTRDLVFSPVAEKHVAAIVSSGSANGLGAVLIDTEMKERVAETDDIRSQEAFTRNFHRRGRFSSPDDQDIINEDKQDFPCVVDEQGWIRTALSRPLCRFPGRQRRLRWGNRYDTNGNRIVVVSDAKKMILIQFGAKPICENHPPLRIDE